MDYTYSLWNSLDQHTGWVAFPFSRGSSQPRVQGIKPRSPALQVDSLPAELQGKTKNIGMSSLPLLQWIFPTQESNWGILHCRQILYQLSYQGSPCRAMQVGLFQCIEGLNRKKTQLGTLSASPQAKTSVFSCLQTQTGIHNISSPSSQTCGLRLKLYHQLFWVSSLVTAHLGTSWPS